MFKYASTLTKISILLSTKPHHVLVFLFETRMESLKSVASTRRYLRLTIFLPSML